MPRGSVARPSYRIYNKTMSITFDPAKRERTLIERGIDFADAAHVFAGPTLTFEDDRHDYGETRLITIGWLGERMVVMVWTPRGEDRRIISMRYANARETTRFAERLG